MAAPPQGRGLAFERRFTRPGVHPFDEVEWELRDAVISDSRGEVVFEQRDVEIPRHWSQMATNVVVSKYFRGVLGSPERERSVKQLIGRVVDSFTGWGRQGGYFAAEDDAETFAAELAHLLVHQKMAFNSPVWFNVGIHEHPQGSACQPARALISTPTGPVPIGDLVRENRLGAVIFDKDGTTRVVGVKANGQKPVHRIVLRNGTCVEATADHVVLATQADATVWQWMRVDQLVPGMHMKEVHHADLPVTVPPQRQTGPSWLWAGYRPASSRHAIVEVEALGVEEVFDIQTESANYLCNNIVVHNCFINSVEDTMESILGLAKTEGMLFKFGSGTGSNLSPIRSSREKLAVGGTASGPLSFMKGYDAIAGAIKSGGATRRAAKMVILNADHPDIADFINCKVDEERKAQTLIAAGYDSALDGPAYASIFFQNSNNSVRVTDDFMKGVLEDGAWHTRFVTTGEVADTYRARDLMRQISEAAWHCGDPGMQFDTTINDWHTSPAHGRINASNPCFTGETRVLTDRGWLRIASIVQRAAKGELVKVVTDESTNGKSGLVHSLPYRFMVTGRNPVLKVTFNNGQDVRCTPNHRFWTLTRGWVRADELQETDDVLLSGAEPLHADRAALDLPLAGELAAEVRAAGTLPLQWTDELAEFVGHVVATGSVAGETLNWTYDSEEQRHLLPRHRELFATVSGEATAVSVSDNGTVSLRTDSLLGRYLGALGVDRVGVPASTVPEALFSAPAEAVSAFLRGAFSAGGTVNASGAPAARYIALGSRSRHFVQEVQLLLQGLGVPSQVAPEMLDAGGGIRQPGFQVRLTGAALVPFRENIGLNGAGKRQRLERMARPGSHPDPWRAHMVARIEDGVELTYNLSEPRNHSYVAQGLAVANCSEYMYLDDTACNLASLNLMKFVNDSGEFDVESFRHAVGITISAQEMIVSFASYPTERIEINSHRFRTLGLGYANLGALLMSRGLPYDSDSGRAYAAAITALMTGEAYRQSARIAAQVGPCEGYPANREPMQRVIGKHREAAYAIDRERVPEPLLDAAREAWDGAFDAGVKHGFRNMQVTVLAPTGTIAFMMDCDTTGIEPDIALVKYKKLVGGGLLKIVNNTVPEALEALGYEPAHVEDIVNHLGENDTIEGAPHLKDEHLPVFDCAFQAAKGKRSIHYMGHIRMMSAAQPFISGAISKTVNLPNEATPEDLEEAYVQAWKLGLKAIAVYRDGCKMSQPLNTSRDAGTKSGEGVPSAFQEVPAGVPTPTDAARALRRRLPDERRSITHKFDIQGHEGYITVGMYEDGSPGEIFLVMAKEGSTISGLMDSFATMVSLSLQYGVPLQALVDKFSHSRFEPSGFTKNPEIPIAKSIVDYIFRWLATKFLHPDEQDAVGIIRRDVPSDQAAIAEVVSEPVASAAIETEAPAALPRTETGGGEITKIAFHNTTDAPTCSDCGSIMVRNGSCYKCLNCGATSGCS
ncbi:MAG: TSCPD domain-containing protein [Candidatus Dormibacteria bacterium]